MGVLGLWNLLEPVGKPVPIESLENKILAVDISIWLNQAVKGYRDRTGNAVPHAHLLGLYHRVCKLLFYRIKPVFIFDGQPPQLKRDTLIRRRMRKSKVNRKAQAASAKILDNYLKSQAIAQKLQRQTHAIEKINRGGTDAIHNLLSKRAVAKEKDLFELPDLPQEIKKPESDSDSSESDTEIILDQLGVDTSDIYNLDVHSDKFKTLPQDLKYDVLSEMREKRKQNSWAKIHQMPSKAENFSSFQLERLKHRRNIQKTLDNVKDTLKEDIESSYSEQLFVGDLGGLKSIKKEMKKAASNPGSATLFVSGIQSAKEAEKIREMQLQKKLKERKEQELARLGERRELVDNPDDPNEILSSDEDQELSLAIAMSMEDQGASQDEIYKMIKKEEGGDWIKQERDPSNQIIVKGMEGEEIILLPSASNDYITSNRTGGQIIKIEIKEEPGLEEEETAALSVASTDSEKPKLENSAINLPATKFEMAVSHDVVSNPKVDHSALLEIFEKGGDKQTKKKDEGKAVEVISDSDHESEGVGVMSDSEESDNDKVSIMSDSDSSSDTTQITLPQKSAKIDQDDLFADIFDKPENVSKLENILASKEISNRSKDKDEDLFADIFSDTDNVDKLSDILAPKKVTKEKEDEISRNKYAEDILAKVTKLDKPTDIFSAISASARGRVESEIESPTKKTSTIAKPVPKAPVVASGGFINNHLDTDESSGPAPEEVAAAMASSNHLWMKIASKYAHEAAGTTKSPVKDNLKRPANNDVNSRDKKKVKSVDESEPDLLGEQDRLIKEMKEKEKANRLLKFTQLTYNDGKDNEINDEDIDDPDDDQFSDDNTTDELARLGVETADADKYKTRILREEGLIDQPKDKSDKNKNVATPEKRKERTVYSASAPGFNRGSLADTETVVDVTGSGPSTSNMNRDIDISDAGTTGDDLEVYDEAELYRIQAELAQENSALVAEMNKADRVANSITDQMYAECQELLQLFGIPWIVSPTEAESQCAWLDANGLTQGTITDDSDIWLFGGHRVYKNFFNQEKFVEMFKYEEIEHHFGLNREKMILVGMLTGSDYTEGVEGVGPVTALEVLAEFPGEGIEPLVQLKNWWERVHKEYGKDFGMPVGNKTREKLRKIKLTSGFPSDQVMAAYMNPKIDANKEKFSWSIPNFVAVRDFAQERFGWAKAQVDELIQPVIRSLQKSSQQGRIDSYFTSYRVNLPDKGLQSSKRVTEALRKVKGLPTPEKEKQAVLSPQKAALKSSISAAKSNLAAVNKTIAATKSNSTAPQSNMAAVKSNMAAVKSTMAAQQRIKKASTAVIDTEASGKQPAEGIPGTSREETETEDSSLKKQELSLVARSCGMVIRPGKDDLILQREERKQREKEARERAAEIWKKTQKQKEKKKMKRPARIHADDHHLSDEEEQ